MTKTSVEGNVGLFVFITLLLLAGMLLYFSKGLGFLTPGYEINLRTSNVGGIKPEASVLIAGIVVGSVKKAELGPTGTNVLLTLRINSRYQVYTNALFVIEQAGFLGDEYVAIYPQPGNAPAMQPGDTAVCAEPFNLQEAARAATGFIRRIDETAQRLNTAIVRVDRLVLNEETLTNLAVTVGQLRKVSERAVATVDRIDSLIESNTPAVNLAVTNLVAFSDQLKEAAASLQNIVATNKDEVTAAVKNIESATTLLNSLLTDLQAGKGLAGSLLKNERTEREFGMVLGNLNTLSSNLTVTSSNLNAHGIWWMLWKPKPERTSRVATPAGRPGGR